MTINLIGRVTSMIDIDVMVSFDVLTPGGWETCDYGKYRVREYENNLERGTTTLRCLNMMGILAETPYESGVLTFPCTVAELAQQVADRFGFTINTDMTSLPNHDYTITEDLYANIHGTAYRDVLAEIAGATGTMAKFRPDSTLDLVSAQMTAGDELTYDNLRRVKFEPKWGVLNALVLARTPQEDNIVFVDQPSIEVNGRTDIKLANNEILDDNRQAMGQAILDTVTGFDFSPFTATTIGLGWIEVGDRLSVTDPDGVKWEVVPTNTRIEIGQGIKETIDGAAPEPEATDYARAGGMTRTIFNTEIKVDRQGQQIESVVSRQDEFEGETQSSFTQVVQNLTNIVTSVQNSGGANLIRNSAGFFLGEDGLPTSWDADTSSGALVISASSDAISNGSLSGNIIILRGAKINQHIPVVADDGTDSAQRYSFSVRVKKGAVGVGSVKLTDGIQTWELSLSGGETAEYELLTINSILPHTSGIDLVVSGSPDSDFTVTDMMLAVGEFTSQWTQANGEFANTQVNIDINGVTVRSSTVAGAATLQSPFQFAGYRNGVPAHSLDADAVRSRSAILADRLVLPPIQMVGVQDGIAFVPVTGNGR
ncbi:hypothetical protein FWH13_01545 [Candidatus Saccharibacteria bacterium]|nr:hypothetical protein [Candidatus Saccharibacteria bacterium]